MANCTENDCIKFPIPEECFDFCIERTLSIATIEEKILILGLNPGIARKIFSAYQSRNIQQFEDLNIELTIEEMIHVRTKFRGLNQYQHRYFLLNQNRRRSIVNALRGLDLNI